jgi:hypothetical protein
VDLYNWGVFVGTLECPFCYEILEVKPLDQLHSAFSTEKPMKNSYHGNVIKRFYNCPNPECKKPVAVYWYAPLEYLNRI